MTEGLLPLFPLETVLLPGQRMALHIFEERYREMIGECLARGQAFGIVRTEGRDMARRGCTAMVEEVLKRYDDGRLDIMAVGEQRFEILELNDERSFLQAKVRWFGDEPGTMAPERLTEEVVAAWAELNRLKGGEEGTPESGDPEASYRMAQISDDLDFRQMVLELRSDAERMELLLEQMRKEARNERVRQEMKKVVRSNGHGKHLDGADLGGTDRG